VARHHEGLPPQGLPRVPIYGLPGQKLAEGAPAAPSATAPTRKARATARRKVARRKRRVKRALQIPPKPAARASSKTFRPALTADGQGKQRESREAADVPRRLRRERDAAKRERELAERSHERALADAQRAQSELESAQKRLHEARDREKELSA